MTTYRIHTSAILCFDVEAPDPESAVGAALDILSALPTTPTPYPDLPGSYIEVFRNVGDIEIDDHFETSERPTLRLIELSRDPEQTP